MQTRAVVNVLSLDSWRERLVAALASGVLLAFSHSLTPCWLVAWIAPIPVLAASFCASLREAQQLAIVIIGGLLSATVLTLIVLPALYLLFAGRQQPPVIGAQELFVEQGLSEVVNTEVAYGIANSGSGVGS